MNNETHGGKQFVPMNIESILNRYKAYTGGRSGTQYNMFYAFVIDELQDLQATLYNEGIKDCLLNERGVFFKRSDIFRSMCIDKLVRILNQNDKVYVQSEQNIYLGDDSYHKPDITLFTDLDESSYDDYVDQCMGNPSPNIIIEVVDINKIDFLYDLIRVYRKVMTIYKDLLILFVDPIKKELYMFRNDMQIVISEQELLFYLKKIDYFRDSKCGKLIINFESMLKSK